MSISKDEKFRELLDILGRKYYNYYHILDSYLRMLTSIEPKEQLKDLENSKIELLDYIDNYFERKEKP